MLIADRFEGDKVVCETDDGSMVHLCLSDFFGAVKEGDVLILKNGKYTADQAETKKRREMIQKLSKELFE